MAGTWQHRSTRMTTDDLDGSDLHFHRALSAATASSAPTTPAQSLGDPYGPGDRPARDVGHHAVALASAISPADDAPTPTGDAPSVAVTIIPNENPAPSGIPCTSPVRSRRRTMDRP